MDINRILINKYSKAVKNQIIQKIHTAEKKLQSYIIPIYCEWGKDNLTLLGSGILLEIKSKYILLTSAHVIDDSKEGEIAIPFENTLDGLDGFYCSPIPDRRTRDDDMYDFAFAYLNCSTVNGLLNNYSFLSSSKLLYDEIDTQVKIYSIIGFPGKKNITNFRIKPSPYSYLNSAINESNMAKYDLNHNTNLAISYNSKSTYSSDGLIQQAPKPKGMSGGGIFTWKIEDKLGLGNYKVTPYLAGVFIGTSKNNTIWIGTKINAVLQGIRNTSSTLKQFIPDYNMHNLNLEFKRKC